MVHFFQMLENNWFVGCASIQLKKQAFATTILDKNIVLLRGADGTPSALLDRCCHRGYPLSCKPPKNGNLVCGYHGWEFDSSGKCVKIPSLSPDEKIPSRYRVPSFTCAEHDGYVWIWMGKSKPTSPPRMPEFATGRWMQGSRVLNCNYVFALEITYDMAHILHVHWNHGATQVARKTGISSRSHELQLTERGCRIVFSGDKFSTSEFELPGKISIQSLRNKNYLHFFVTPISERQCRLDFLNTSFKPNAKRLQWVGEGGKIIDEDQAVLEKVQRTYDNEGDAFQCSTEADLPTLTLRKVLRSAESGRWNPRKSGLPLSRIFTITYPY